MSADQISVAMTTPLPPGLAERLRGHLDKLYPPQDAALACAELLDLVAAGRGRVPAPGRADDPFDETDVVLITYPDQVVEPGRAPLETLADFLETHVSGVISGLHVLPFYPWTSDDGFSVVDYDEVEPDLGTWADIERLTGRFRFMADAVFNHVSASSTWFRGWREGDPAYADFFIAPDARDDLAVVTRPRSTPLLTRVRTATGPQHVWTTFSRDQVDLNYANWRVLVAVTRSLLGYLAHGIRLIRLDAVAYLWKRAGTRCIHLAETHEIIRLWRTVVEAVAPDALLITETNVPHAENVRYFGAGTDEAHLVYQFPLAPLVLSTFHLADASVLAEWAQRLDTPSSGTTFFNFLGSHDGIGVRPVEGMLTRGEIEQLCALARHHGGGVSHRAEPGGRLAPYELNTVYFDALTPADTKEPLATQVARFMAAQSILLTMAGVPGIYVHSLLGSRNWIEGVERTGRLRTINRQKFERRPLERELGDIGSRRQRVFTGLMQLIALRTTQPAFHPNAGQRVLATPPRVFALERTARDGSSTVVAVHNIAGVSQPVQLRGLSPRGDVVDLISERGFSVGATGELDLTLEPYEVLWLRGSPSS